MGMYDDIIVPKTYLKSLLNKEDEKLFKTNHLFQTKDMDNIMNVYKVHRQRLYKLERNGVSEKKEKWTSVNDNVDIRFYDNVKDEKGDEWWAEFKFTFRKGKVDTKRKIKLNLETKKEVRDETERMWKTEQEIFNFFRDRSIRYRTFSLLEKIFQKATNWARKNHYLPLSLRQEAYEKSGRLKKDPDCLGMYEDA